MRRWSLRFYTIGSCLGAALLAGCSGSQPPNGAPATMPQSRALAERGNNANFKLLYSFVGGDDGAHPAAPLLDEDGTLYGTTTVGGDAYATAGTVYSITTSGSEKLLYSFTGVPNGSNPTGSLIDVGGTLYGTTTLGGPRRAGTVFSVTTSGVENVLHKFGSGTDGVTPAGGLIDVKGTLYGTTIEGGADNEGTVFSVTTKGTEKVLYSFRGEPDGNNPWSALLDVAGTLYGTTNFGGAYNLGTVFSITTSGTQKVPSTASAESPTAATPEEA
ncbi:MAG TPA: choice-of-anchor tandem repeat GloVer-containing protein [Candidatus Cybelea sp.]|nr:choice-of-anchor tandem repeat GloVer-containing protein [Candidatus Cybelea sp.]